MENNKWQAISTGESFSMWVFVEYLIHAHLIFSMLGQIKSKTMTGFAWNPTKKEQGFLPLLKSFCHVHILLYILLIDVSLCNTHNI